MRTAVYTLILAFLAVTPVYADFDTDQGIGPPARSKDLPPGHFLRIQNNAADDPHDLGVVRQLPNGGTAGATADGGMNSFCQDGLVDCGTFGSSLDYGMPLYAPVEGVVASCWRNHPNSPIPDLPHPLRCCGGLTDTDGACTLRQANGNGMACDHEDCASAIASCNLPECTGATPNCPITRSGNHLVMLTNDSHQVLYAHLVPGSIPRRLCPFEGEFMSDANVMACANCPAPAEAVIPMDERPRVERGDFVGRIGRSGAAGGPHLHFRVRKMIENPDGTLARDTSEPNDGALRYSLRNAWARPSNDPEGWEKLAGQPAPMGQLIHPTPFLRRANLTDSSITDVETTTSAVTMARLPDDRTELVSWDVDPDGSLEIQDRATTTGTTTLFDLARPGNARNVVTGKRAANGELRLDFWRVAQNGTITRGDADTSSGAIQGLDMASWPSGRGVASAVITADGRLRLITWTLNDQNEIERLDSATGDSVNLVAVTPIRFGREQAEPVADSFRGFVTAAKRPNGNLQLASWSLEPATGEVNLINAENFGEIDGQLAVAAVEVDAQREMVVVAGRHDGQTRQFSVAVSSDGSLTRKSGRQLLDGTDIGVSPVAAGRYIVSLRAANSGDLRVFGMSIGPKGKLIFLGDEAAGTADAVGSSILRRGNGEIDLVFTAVRNGAGNLQTIIYDANLD